MATAQFLSVEACAKIKQVAEEEASAAGGWTADDPRTYSQSTTDIEIDKLPRLRQWLLDQGFMERIQRLYMQAFAKTITALDDAFIVKYVSGQQVSLEPHTDAGDISFMIALSTRRDYTGGGTLFHSLEDVVHLEQGQILVFHAKYFHEGMAITSGERYLLVGFCFTEEAARLVPGNLNLQLELILEPATRGSKRARLAEDSAAARGSKRARLAEDSAAVREPPSSAPLLDSVRQPECHTEGDEAFASYRLREGWQGCGLHKEAIALHAECAGQAFWLPAAAHARTALEHFAQAVLKFHGGREGVEFWVQLLDAEGAAPPAIPFHFDKDEAALRKTDVFRHPLRSVVTYLSHSGAPTVIFDRRISPSGELSRGKPSKAYVSYPRGDALP
eukprot:gene6937-8275_t